MDPDGRLTRIRVGGLAKKYPLFAKNIGLKAFTKTVKAQTKGEKMTFNQNDDLSRKQVMKLFGIDNFRELSTEKAFNVANKLAELKPEVAMKVLEQFPECASTIVKLAKSMCEVDVEAMEQGNKSTHRQVESLKKIVDILEEQIQSESISPEERMRINEQIIEVAKLLDKADERQHNFILAIAERVTMAAVTLASIMVVVLVGGKIGEIIPSRKAA